MNSKLPACPPPPSPLSPRAVVLGTATSNMACAYCDTAGPSPASFRTPHSHTYVPVLPCFGALAATYKSVRYPKRITRSPTDSARHITDPTFSCSYPRFHLLLAHGTMASALKPPDATRGGRFDQPDIKNKKREKRGQARSTVMSEPSAALLRGVTRPSPNIYIPSVFMVLYIVLRSVEPEIGASRVSKVVRGGDVSCQMYRNTFVHFLPSS